MSRIALYGGSFDPPHTAHVLTVAYALSACPVDAVWVVPVWQHAFGKHLTPFEARVAMCRRAFAIFGDRIDVSRAEEALGGVSRTIDTVRHLVAAHPEHAFALVLGTDLFAERHRWKAFDELERLVPMHVVGRAGAPAPEGVVAGPPLPPVSSTEIRRRLAAGEPVDGLLPLAVVDYVRTHALYGASSSG